MKKYYQLSVFPNLKQFNNYFQPTTNMRKMIQGKILEFVDMFGLRNEKLCLSAEEAEAKEKVLKEFGLEEEYFLNFEQGIPLYRQVLQQDRFSELKEKKNWHKEEVKLLVFMISQFHYSSRLDIQRIDVKNWICFSNFFTGRSPVDCKFKWLSVSKHPVNVQGWDNDEEALLRSILQEMEYQKTRPRWKLIAIEFNNRSAKNDYIYRTSKQLKKRWVSNICRIEKGLWQKSQDLFLLESVSNYGKRWSFISKLMQEKRTENGVKNRFFSVIEKETQACMKKRIIVSQAEIISRIIKNLQTSLKDAVEVDDSDRDDLNHQKLIIGQQINNCQHEPVGKDDPKTTSELTSKRKGFSKVTNQSSKPQFNSIFPSMSYTLISPIYFGESTLQPFPMMMNYGMLLGAQVAQYQKNIPIEPNF